MGDLVLCMYQTAERPYMIQNIGFPLYSLEELCYYIEENFYMVDKKLLNLGLCLWLKQEIGFLELARELDLKLRRKEPLFRGALLILEKSGLYDQEELARMEELFESVDGKAVMECWKLKADQYLLHGKYAFAAAEYRHLLKPENQNKMTDELRGALYHNQGVAYARSFLFPEAAECFLKACEQYPAEKSRQAYLYCLNFMDGSETIGENGTGQKIDFETMKSALEEFEKISLDPTLYQERSRVSAGQGGDLSADQVKENAGLAESWKEAYLKSF